MPAEKVPEYFTDFGQTFGHDRCPVAWYFAQVEPDGEVCFCGDFPDYFIGNVRRQSFREIWTGPKAWRFREKLAKEPLPICARCCGNYVYGKWGRPVDVAFNCRRLSRYVGVSGPLPTFPDLSRSRSGRS